MTITVTVSSDKRLTELRACVIARIHDSRDRIEAAQKRLKYWRDQPADRMVSGMTVAQCVQHEEQTIARLSDRLTELEALLTELCS